MKFVYASPTETILEIAEVIQDALEYGTVLLLVSGGSNIKTAVEVRNKIKPTNKLTVGLVDERYGPIGHPSSNWQQLLSAGFDTKHIRLLPVITSNQESIADTSHSYQEKLRDAVKESDTVIGIFGIGSDGHTAGILPDSPAINSHELVTYFNGPDYSRITITPAAMSIFNTAFLVGDASQKADQLKKLRESLPIEKQPAQALKLIPNLIVYADYINTEE